MRNSSRPARGTYRLSGIQTTIIGPTLVADASYAISPGGNGSISFGFTQAGRLAHLADHGDCRWCQLRAASADQLYGECWHDNHHRRDYDSACHERLFIADPDSGR